MTTDLTLLQAAVQKMRWHETRQKALSQNIANADTPGYRPQDVTPLDFKSLLESSSSKLSISAGQLATTDPKHIGLNSALSSPGKTLVKEQKKTYDVAPDGNAVDLEEQLLKMNQNYTDHRLTTTIYQKNIDMLKSSMRSQ
jgi:flagellar basal-body rod protein FlgB